MSDTLEVQPLPFTVVGYFNDNGQVWVRHAAGFGLEDAVASAVREVKTTAKVDYDDIAVVEVFEGHNKPVGAHDHVVPACEWPGVGEPEEGN